MTSRFVKPLGCWPTWPASTVEEDVFARVCVGLGVTVTEGKVEIVR